MSARAWLLAAFVVAVPPAVAAAQEDSLASARDLYTMAAYEDALAMLDRLAAERPAPSDVPAIEQYRAFALIALGRLSEAEHAIERIAAADPAWELPEGEAPPRIAAMFSSVRERVLPAIVRQRIDAARTLYNDRKYAEAADAFTGVIALLKEPSVVKAMGAELPALETIATGFRDLALAAEEQAGIAAEQAARPANAPAASPADAAPADEPAAQTTATREDEAASSDSAAAPAASAGSVAPVADPATGDREGQQDNARNGGSAPAAVEAAPGASDGMASSLPPGVVAPKVIVQQLPAPSGLAVPLGGPTVVVFEVTIDELGRVERTRVPRSVNPAYEAQLSAAARHWRYVPATKDGRPIKFVKTLAITLSPR